MGSQSYIKYITRLPIREQMKSKLVKSILDHTSENKKYKFVFDVNGTLVERTYNQSFVVGNHNIEQTGPYNKLAKIYRKDGSFRYGIVGFRKVEKTIGRKLVSLYVRKLRNPNTGEWEWPGTLYKDDAPDDDLGKKMKFYREDMEKVVETKDIHKLKCHFGTTTDYSKLYWFVNSKANTFKRSLNRWIEALPMGEMPEDLEGFHSIQAHRLKYSLPPIGYERWDGLPPVFMTFVKTQYLKSIYKDVKIKVVRKEVFYLDDLLMIFDPDLVDIEDETPDVVWSSLDETCKGNA
jgi:hypothetical protein